MVDDSFLPGMPISAGAFAPSFAPSVITRPMRIRKDFAEAWIFDSFSTGGSEMLVAK